MVDMYGIIILVILVSIMIIFFIVEVNRKPLKVHTGKNKYSPQSYYANYMGHTPSNIMSVSSNGVTNIMKGEYLISYSSTTKSGWLCLFDDGVKILETVPPSVRTVWQIEKNTVSNQERTIGTINGPTFTIQNNEKYLSIDNNITSLSNNKAFWTMIKDPQLSVSPIDAGNYRLSINGQYPIPDENGDLYLKKVQPQLAGFFTILSAETGIGVRIDDRKTCKHLCDVNPVCQSYIYTNKSGCVLSTKSQIPTTSMNLTTSLSPGPLKGVETVTGIKLGSTEKETKLQKKSVQIINVQTSKPLNIKNNTKWDIIPCQFHSNLYTIKANNNCLTNTLDMKNCPVKIKGQEPITWIKNNSDLLWYISVLDKRQKSYSLMPYFSRKYLGTKDDKLIFKNTAFTGYEWSIN